MERLEVIVIVILVVSEKNEETHRIFTNKKWEKIFSKELIKSWWIRLRKKWIIKTDKYNKKWVALQAKI